MVAARPEGGRPSTPADGRKAGWRSRPLFKLVVLASGSGSNLQVIIDRLHGRVAGIEIVGVFSDIPGVLALGTQSGGGEPAHIVVYVDKVTPEVRAAVPATLDGYRVDVEAELVLPPSPPMLVGVVKKVTAATPEQAAVGIAGVLTIEGDLYQEGDGESTSTPRTLVVRVPTAVRIWRPQGEGKEFISFADVRVGDTAQATLTVIPAAKALSATAADLEVSWRE